MPIIRALRRRRQELYKFLSQNRYKEEMEQDIFEALGGVYAHLHVYFSLQSNSLILFFDISIRIKKFIYIYFKINV